MATQQVTAIEECRLDVESDDGTSIAVWVEGQGPPMVLVHGSIGDHTFFEPFVAVLRDRWTTYAMDRRGFGGKGDGDAYSIEQDFADVAAVVDAVASRAGGSVLLWGHSYGANAAMGGAARSVNVARLVLYEPSLGLQYPPGSIDAIEEALARGDRDAAIVGVFADILELSDAEIDEFRADPRWPDRLAAAHTIPRECRVEEGWVFEPGQFDAITAPTLILSGSDSPVEVVAATERAAGAIPDATIEILEGHAHLAVATDPELVAGLVDRFSRRV